MLAAEVQFGARKSHCSSSAKRAKLQDLNGDETLESAWADLEASAILGQGASDKIHLHGDEATSRNT